MVRTGLAIWFAMLRTRSDGVEGEAREAAEDEGGDEWEGILYGRVAELRFQAACLRMHRGAGPGRGNGWGRLCEVSLGSGCAVSCARSCDPVSVCRLLESPQLGLSSTNTSPRTWRAGWLVVVVTGPAIRMPWVPLGR